MAWDISTARWNLEVYRTGSSEFLVKIICNWKLCPIQISIKYGGQNKDILAVFRIKTSWTSETLAAIVHPYKGNNRSLHSTKRKLSTKKPRKLGKIDPTQKRDNRNSQNNSKKEFSAYKTTYTYSGKEHYLLC